jgi:hypothetical protein
MVVTMRTIFVALLVGSHILPECLLTFLAQEGHLIRLLLSGGLTAPRDILHNQTTSCNRVRESQPVR